MPNLIGPQVSSGVPRISGLTAKTRDAGKNLTKPSPYPVHQNVVLPRGIVPASPRGAICFHPSLLPRYRGERAVRDALAAGETTRA